MNVLLFVMTMLMVFAMLTYAKVESYRSFSHLQIQFQEYMRVVERKHLSDHAEVVYKKTRVGSKNGSPNKNTRTQASPRLSWNLIVNRDERAKNPEKHDLILGWSKKLIHLLYGDQKFFQEAVEKRPNLLDELFNSLTQVIDNLPKEQSIKEASDLANLDLGDFLLNETLYKMLKGNPIIEKPKMSDAIISMVPANTSETPEEEDAESSSEGESEAAESRADSGYVSLLDYITTSNSQKIRVYLAPRELLLAIFGDSGIVNDIRMERMRLYSQVRSSGGSNATATANFQTFMQSRMGNLDLKLFDFTVTKVNPADYEKIEQ